MESLILTALKGNWAALILVLLAGWYIYRKESTRLVTMCDTLMVKLDKLTESIATLAHTSIAHDKDIEFGAERRRQLEKDFSDLKKENLVIRESLHDVRGSMITPDQLQSLIDKV